MFKHFFLTLEVPSKAPDKLPTGAVYNLIGKAGKPDVDYITPADIVTLPDNVEEELSGIARTVVEMKEPKLRDY